MIAFRRIVKAALAASVALAAAAPFSANAEGRLEAQYEATLAGIPIGKASWTVEVGDTHYSATVHAATTGLVQFLAGAEGTGLAQGTISGGKLMSALYSSNIKVRKKKDEVRLVVANGNVKEFTVEPPLNDDPERVPLTPAHQRGILDPMSGMLLRVPGNGNMLVPESCQHRSAVFDGRLRYNLEFAFKRMEHVKAKGYDGPVLVCAVYFTPVAGFVPSRKTIKYIAALRDIEIWMAPIAGTRVLGIIRAQAPTPLGEVKLVARQFVSVAGPVRPSNGTKTQ